MVCEITQWEEIHSVISGCREQAKGGKRQAGRGRLMGCCVEHVTGASGQSLKQQTLLFLQYMLQSRGSGEPKSSFGSLLPACFLKGQVHSSEPKKTRNLKDMECSQLGGM